MNKKIVVFFYTIIFAQFLTPFSFAELWVKHNNGTFQTKYAGDCKTAGFCGNNNSNLESGWIEVPQAQYDLAGKYSKVVNGEVVSMTQQEIDDINAAEASAAQASLLAGSRAGAKDSVDQLSPEGVRLRASLLVVLDRFNTVTGRINAVESCIEGAGTLAAAKTCLAGLSAIPDVTAAQMKTAIKNAIDGGQAD